MQGGVGHRQAWRREGDPRWYRGRWRRSRVRGVEVDEVRTRTGIDVEPQDAAAVGELLERVSAGVDALEQELGLEGVEPFVAPPASAP